MGGLANIDRVGRQVVAEFSGKNVAFMAAGVAYNAFVSLAPMLLILLFVLSAVGGGLEERIVALARTSLPGPIADVVAGVFEGDSGSSGASVVGLVVLVWGTLKIFRGLDTAFSEIYETTGSNSFLDKVVDGLVVFVAILIAVLATVGVSAAFAALSDAIPFVGLVTPVVLLVGLFVAFLPLYRRFPDVDVGWRHVVPGAAFAAVGWAAFQAAFQVYLSFTGDGTGSFFGGVLVVVTWLYFSGLVLLVGAVINAVLGGYASGEAGGVGMGATGYETEREVTLDADEFDGYLRDLRSDVAGPGDEPGPGGAEGTGRPVRPGGADGTGRSGMPDGTRRAGRRPELTGGERTVRPRPKGDVEVIEQSKLDGDELKWAVSIRWRATVDPDRPSESAGR